MFRMREALLSIASIQGKKKKKKTDGFSNLFLRSLCTGKINYNWKIFKFLNLSACHFIE
jgi:hypothetical protein